MLQTNLKGDYMEFTKKDVIEMVDSCEYPIHMEQYDDEDCAYGTTLRGELIKVVLNGKEFKCSGFTVDEDYVTFECPVIGDFDLVECNYLAMQLLAINSLEVIPITIMGIPASKEVYQAYKKANSVEEFVKMVSKE